MRRGICKKDSCAELILNSIPKTELDEVCYDTQADSLKLVAETKTQKVDKYKNIEK